MVRMMLENRKFNKNLNFDKRINIYKYLAITIKMFKKVP